MRDDRTRRLVGTSGLQQIQGTSATIVGLGGLGSHVAIQLAYLGVGSAVLVDHDRIENSNLNRTVGATPADVGRYKTEVSAREMWRARPELSITRLDSRLQRIEVLEAILKSDVVFGCLDNDSARLVLTEACLAYDVPYIDLATEIVPNSESLTVGGRVCCTVLPKQRCLVCLDQLDDGEQEAGYGEGPQDPHEPGPAVVSVNGVIASLAATEFLLWRGGIRGPRDLLTYRANMGGVTVEGPPSGKSRCILCSATRGTRDASNVQRLFSSSLPRTDLPSMSSTDRGKVTRPGLDKTE